MVGSSYPHVHRGGFGTGRTRRKCDSSPPRSKSKGPAYHPAVAGTITCPTRTWGVGTVSSSIGKAWEEAASDPDPHADLKYELQPLTVIQLEEHNGGEYMILPAEADQLKLDEFITADPGSICRLDECR